MLLQAEARHESMLAAPCQCTIVSHVNPFSRKTSGTLLTLAIAFALLSLPAARPAQAQQRQAMTAIGDGSNLWIIRVTEAGDKFTLMHRKPTDLPETRLTPLPEPIFGRIAPNGIAAGQGKLLLVYSDQSVQSIRVVEDSAGRRGFSDLMLPSLPKGAALRSLTVGQSGPWALVRIEDPKVLEAIDQPDVKPSPKIDAKKETKEDDDNAPAKDAGKNDGTDKLLKTPPATPSNDRPQVKADRLLQLKGDRWISIPMPADWPKDAEGWIVNQFPGDEHPLLIVATEAPRVIRTYRWVTGDAKQPGQWTRRDRATEHVINLPPNTASQQLVVARRTNAQGKIEVVFSAVRQEELAEIGTLSLPDPIASWSITTLGDRLALIAESEEKLLMRRIDITGNVIDVEPMPLQSQPPPLGPVADLFVFIAVLMLATPMLILMLRRDPSAPIVELPASLRLGDLPLRGIAAAIDLAPCVGAVVFFWQVSVMDLIDAWPGNSGGWEAMIPGLVVIGSFVGYSALSEVFFATTIGKAIMGLRITGLKGEPPDVWQVLSRNGLKALDLIAPPLIIFAIISPSRQRLGDVVARTVVVTRVKPDDDDPNIRKDNRSDKAKPLDPRPHKPGKKE